jgi:hypothetical protein
VQEVIASTFNLASILGGEATVTSDIIVTRDSDDSKDNVIFGVTIMKASSQNFVISMDANGKINIHWHTLVNKVPTFGQEPYWNVTYFVYSFLFYLFQ